MRKGNNPNMLPEPPKTFDAGDPVQVPRGSLIAVHDLTLQDALVLDGLLPQNVKPGESMKITALLPDGTVKPLLWLYQYSDKHGHPFLLRAPLNLPAGTVIRGVRPPARVTLLPVITGKTAE